MTNNTTIYKRFITIVTFFLLIGGLSAQDSKSSIKAAVESKQFVFVAQTALPQNGGTRQLGSEYDLRLNNDTIIAYLPYFGRAYNTVPYGSEGGIKFTSTNSEYAIENKKKGGWEIVIRPKDVKDIQELILNISEDGYGSLQVSSLNRQSITFYGVVKK